MIRGYRERALIVFMEHRGHFFESEVTALKMMADAGWNRERAAEILLEAIKTGVNPIARVRNLIAREQNQYPHKGRYERATLSDFDEALVESLHEYMRRNTFG